MRKNKFFIAGLVTVFVALVSLTLVSSTWAKYTSTVSGQDSARVAKWAWEYKGEALTTDTVKFDLFETILDSDLTNAETDVDVNGAADDATVIAPGTSGQFVVLLENNSEVNATYEIDYTVTNANNIPVEFSVNGGSWGTLEDVTATVIAMNGGAAQYTIQWRWVFDGDDSVDTPLGIAGSAEIIVHAKITMTQVD